MVCPRRTAPLSARAARRAPSARPDASRDPRPEALKRRQTGEEGASRAGRQAPRFRGAARGLVAARGAAARPPLGALRHLVLCGIWCVVMVTDEVCRGLSRLVGPPPAPSAEAARRPLDPNRAGERPPLAAADPHPGPSRAFAALFPIQRRSTPPPARACGARARCRVRFETLGPAETRPLYELSLRARAARV